MMSNSKNKPTKVQLQYIANWNDSFVNYTKSLMSIINELELMPQATDQDKHCMKLLKIALICSDVKDVEKDLSGGIVRTSTLDKITKLNKHLTDICLEHIYMSPMIREFWKKMAYIKIDSDKNAEILRLNALKIQIPDDNEIINH